MTGKIDKDELRRWRHARSISSKQWQKARPALSSAIICATVLGCGKSPNETEPEGLAEPKPPIEAVASTEAQVRMLTGARTRVAWCQDQDDQRDYRGKKNRFKLLAFDSDDARGEREILASSGHYNKPLITRKGDRVVFTDYEEKQVYVVNWDGSGLRRVTSGFGLDVWVSPKDGTEWVYVQVGAETSDKTFDKNPVRRCQLDNPKVNELVWDKTPVSARWAGNFQISADGTKAGGLFPWPEGGIAELPNKSWRSFGNGCWTSLASDGRFWKFDGAHRNLLVYDPGSSGRIFVGRGRKVNVSLDPRIGGYEVYHPRWSNHERFLAMTGPYRVDGLGDKSGGRIGNGGAGVEVFLGRFDKEFTRVEHWVQVTRNRRADFFPDVWIDPQGASTQLKVPTPISTPAAVSQETWPGKAEGLVFLWENRSSMNEVFDWVKRTNRTCRVEPRGRAIYGRFFEMELGQGAFLAPGADEAILSACQTSHQLSVEALVTPAQLALPRPAPIVTYSSSAGHHNFRLIQEGNKLAFVLRTSLGGQEQEAQIEIGHMTELKPHHVVVSYVPGRLVCYLDGRKVLETERWSGDFRAWSPQHLLFGDELVGGASWPGQLEGVAIYSQALSAEQARSKSQWYLTRMKNRKPIEKLVVKARLKESSATPTPESIAPYRRCLVVHSYEVEEILSGKYDQKKLLVASWGILDGQLLPNHARILNAVSELSIEPYDDHPQLEGERLAMDSADLDLPLFYDAQR